MNPLSDFTIKVEFSEDSNPMKAKEVKTGLKRGFWTPEEDLTLKKCVETHGEGNWATISKKLGNCLSPSLQLIQFSLYINVFNLLSLSLP